MTVANYRDFLEAKMPAAPLAGLPCTLDEIPTHLRDGRPLKDHQRHIVRWAVEGGRRALFEAFGLGKSIQQLLICDTILRKLEEVEGFMPDALIVAPLGVRMEFMKDAALLGLTVHFVKSDSDIEACGDAGGIFLTNYESVREGKIDVSKFRVASLDEASVLRSYGSKTFQEFLPLFEAVPYRFVATATPSPNRYKELIHYAGFLGVMDTGQALTRFFQRNSEKANGWTLAHNDCVEEARLLDDDSLDLIVTSIPFSNHYEYTPSYNDFGHTDDDAHFFAQMDYLTPELYRALRPGRLACIHVKDRILFGAVTGEGVPTVNPFHAKTLFHYQRHGFQFMGMITVVTDVVRENNQTYRLSYSEMLKDGTKMGAGSPEYILLMRKPQSDRSRGYADKPVAKSAGDYSLAQWQIDAHAFWRSSGDRPLHPAELAAAVPRFAEMGVGPLVKAFTTESRDLIYDAAAHVAIGETIEARDPNDGRGHLPRTFMSLAPGSHHPDVWDDVVRMRTLNAEQVQKGREKHVCPLQFDIVDRLIDRFSMKGELVYDPFCGLGTVPMRAIMKGRRGRGSELNPDYFRHSCLYLAEAEREAAVPSLFDLLEMEQAA